MTHPSADIGPHERFSALLTAVLNDVDYFTGHEHLADICKQLLAIHVPEDEADPDIGVMATRYRRLVVACLDWAEIPSPENYEAVQFRWGMYKLMIALSG